MRHSVLTWPELWHMADMSCYGLFYCLSCSKKLLQNFHSASLDCVRDMYVMFLISSTGTCSYFCFNSNYISNLISDLLSVTKIYWMLLSGVCWSLVYFNNLAWLPDLSWSFCGAFGYCQKPHWHRPWNDHETFITYLIRHTQWKLDSEICFQ